MAILKLCLMGVRAGEGHYALDPTENRTSLAWDFKPISACPLKCENSKYPSKLWAQLGTHSENTVCV